MSYYRKVNGEILLTEDGHNVLSFFGLSLEDLQVMTKEQLIAHTKKFSDVLNNGKITKSNPHPRTNKPSSSWYGKNYKLHTDEGGWKDEGSYSRYFSLDQWADKTLPFLIVPKASKSERNKGLDEIIPFSIETKWIRPNEPDKKEFAIYLKEKLYRKYKHHEILANELGVAESLIRHWIGKCGDQNVLPTTKHYRILKQKLDLDDRYDKQMLELIEVNKVINSISDKCANCGRFILNSDIKCTCNNPKREYQNKANFHPTVKPLKLMSYLITMGSREGDLVLDPFCGSGTVCIAADQLHRKWIGIERNPEYAEIIKKRLMVPLSQLKLTIY